MVQNPRNIREEDVTIQARVNHRTSLIIDMIINKYTQIKVPIYF